MPIKAVKKINAWSFSRLKDYLRCAFYAKLKHVDRMKEPSSSAMSEGTYVHFLAECFTTKNNKPLPTELADYADRYKDAVKLMSKGTLPPELELFPEEFADLRKRAKSLHVEQNLALTKNWIPTDWFAPDAWVRIKMDCWHDEGGRRVIVDYKNGKVRVEDQEQLDLYAVGAFAEAPPEIEVVDAQLWYLSAGELIAKSYSRDQVPELRKLWLAKTKALLSDSKFAPSPGGHCSWCHFSKAKGGPCKY